MNKRDALAKEVVRVLSESGLGVDDQIKALGLARAEIVRPCRVDVKFGGVLDKPGKNKKAQE